MRRNNTERRAAAQCERAISTIARYGRRSSLTMEEGRKLTRAYRGLIDWAQAYPDGIPGDGPFHDGIPAFCPWYPPRLA